MYLICEGRFIYHSSKDHVHVGKYAFPKKHCRLDWLIAFSGQLKNKPRQKVILQENWFKPLSLKSGKKLFNLYSEPYIKLACQLGLDQTIVRCHGYKCVIVETILTSAINAVTD